ncbi:MAG TPA: hypothetical protein VIM69_04190 [Opitutaceae bacterium]
MKTVTRYATILSACSIMATAGLFADSTADTTSRTTTNSADTVQSPSAQTTPRSDNTMGTSGSTNSTSPNYSSSSSMSSSSSPLSATDPLATSLQSTDYSSRSQLADQVDQRIDAQKDTLKSLKKEGKHLQGQSKSDFKAAWDDVEAREKDLKHSVHEVRNASSDRWDAARSQLASNYQAFEASVSRLQTQVSADTMSSTNSSNTMSK